MRDPSKTVTVEGLGPAATGVILLLGAALSVLVWQALRRQQDVQAEQDTGRYAAVLAKEVEGYVDGLFEGLHLRAEFWASTGVDSKAGYQSVEIFVKENPAILAVLRADPSWQVAGSEEGKEVLRQIVSEFARTESAKALDEVIGPLHLRDGRPIFGFRIRVSELEEHDGTLYAAFAPDVALKSLLEESRALGYAISVNAGETELYRRDSAPARDRVRFARSEPITPRVGARWTMTVWPTTAVMPASPLESPVVVLAIGLLASSLLAAAVHFGTLAWRRASALRLANTALVEQIDESRRGEHELKSLSEELEARVAQRTAELEETIVELETFNYSASHDLRGPLGAVINFAAILSEDYGPRLDATGKEHLERIVRSASAAVSMMDALLAYSRSGRAELHKVPLDMRRLAHEVCEELTSSYPALGCAVKIGDLPDAYADESMMRFVLSNLISNACKFAKDQEPRVEIGGNPGAGEMIYFVRDDGIGFDMRFADKLFKVFERLHPSDRYQGHGVGLAIVARMVRRHGGRVWAQGAVDKGATFYFTLPVPEGADDGRSTS
jgi:signal transduction histidine kinase